MSMRYYEKRANSVARRNGYGRADEIIVGAYDRILHHTRFGYRKYTTGEYVPNSYRNHFGWKNTYYQPAFTQVEIDVAK